MRKRLRIMVAATLLAGAIALPGSVSAHNSGYVGYGCSGWHEVRWFPPLLAQDCFAGQQSGCYLLMRHDYSGVWAPGTYHDWRNIC
jgi:hypothetical protein